jgi:hypothetical protein
VDIIVVTNFTTSDHPDTVLREVCRALETAGPSSEDPEAMAFAMDLVKEYLGEPSVRSS